MGNPAPKYPKERGAWIAAYQAARGCTVEEATRLRDGLEKAWRVIAERKAARVEAREKEVAEIRARRNGGRNRDLQQESYTRRSGDIRAGKEWTDEEAGEANPGVLSPEQQEYVELRARGMTIPAAVEEMDRIRGIDRSRAARREMGYRLEEQTEIHQITMLGMHEMPDRVWEAKKQATLMNIAFRPSPNSGASIRAIELIDRLRFEHKFGTQEAAQRTVKECEDRLKELGRLKVWASRSEGEGHANETTGAKMDHPQGGTDGAETSA